MKKFQTKTDILKNAMHLQLIIGVFHVILSAKCGDTARASLMKSVATGPTLKTLEQQSTATFTISQRKERFSHLNLRTKRSLVYHFFMFFKENILKTQKITVNLRSCAKY